MDMVPNHCSDEHPWFRAAARQPRRAATSGPGSGSATAGTADRRTTGRPCSAGRCGRPVGGDDPQWYLGTFTPYQPDFDHRHPAVEAMFADALRFWFDRGVDGFRVDAVWPVGKDPDLPDCPPLGPASSTRTPASVPRATRSGGVGGGSSTPTWPSTPSAT